VIAILSALAAHALALLVYPGLVTAALLGGAAELAWARLSGAAVSLGDIPRRRPTPVVATVALCSVLAAVQTAAPFNPVPTAERSLVIAAVALAFTAWAELALTVEHVPDPGLVLVVQFCWLLAVMGPAVQPESLRPQVIGNVLVPSLIPVKLACGALYLLCLPAMLRLWPVSSPADRRSRQRIDLARALCWFPYAALFTTLFLTPPASDVAGLARFFGVTLAVEALVIGLGLVMERRGAAVARGFYARALAPYSILVLLLVVATSILMR
jgi:hypothetical protein